MLTQKLKSNPNATLQPKNYYDVKLYLSNEDCFISYYYRIPGTEKFKRFKERLDILKMFRRFGKKEGMFYAEQALEFMKEELKNGFNPFGVVKKSKAASVHIIPALEITKDRLCAGATKTTVASYLENYNRLVKWINDEKLSQKFMIELQLDHAESYKEWLLKNKFAAKTVNSSLSYASALWKGGVKAGAALTDIFDLVDRIKKTERETDKETFEPFTAKEMITIVKFLKESNQDHFLRFVLFIYYAWARPVEITRLRVEDINLQEDIIKFRKGQTKNGKAALVQIVPPLKNILLEMNLHECEPEMYLFSKDNNYLPGIEMISKNMPSDRWFRWIKEKLGIDKEMYGMKHTGNIDYLLRNKGNINLKWQQMQNRHSSAAMTERYIRKLGAFFIEVGEVNFNVF